MPADPAPLAKALRAVHPGKLSAENAEAIAEIAQMSVDADGQEDAEEIQLYFALGKIVYEMAGLKDTETPTFAVDADDDERLEELARTLATKEARELAYAVAHVLTVIDVQIAPEENDFLENLRGALGLGDERADELAEQLAEAITPN